MMLGTHPCYVKLCCDCHWIYRGSGHSNIALFDILKLYGDRIVELHLRQSKDHVWSETFTANGDIDYSRLASEIGEKGIYPHLVLEQAVESGTPHTMDAVNAHQDSFRAVRELFASVYH